MPATLGHGLPRDKRACAQRACVMSGAALQANSRPRRSVAAPHEGQADHGTVERNARHRTGQHRPRADVRDAAGRPGRGRGAHRPARTQRPGRADRQALRDHRPRPALGRAGPEIPRRPRRGAAPDRRRRCADRRLPPRRGRAARPGAGRLPRAQPAAGVWPHDGLRPIRTDGAGGGPRPELHRAHRRAACHRAGRRQAGAAAEPGRRLRRRRAVPGLRPDGRAVRAPIARAAARWWTRRWSMARRR